jgi:hypothetical protein
MSENLSHLKPLVQPLAEHPSPLVTAATSTLSHWFQRFGFGPPVGEPPIDGATLVAIKEDARALRRDAARHADRPPLPF